MLQFFLEQAVAFGRDARVESCLRRLQLFLKAGLFRKEFLFFRRVPGISCDKGGVLGCEALFGCGQLFPGVFGRGAGSRQFFLKAALFRKEFLFFLRVPGLGCGKGGFLCFEAFFGCGQLFPGIFSPASSAAEREAVSSS